MTGAIFGSAPSRCAISRLPEDPVGAFVRLFRLEAQRGIEYSFGPESDTYGTMVSGHGLEFAGRIRAFAELLPFANEWVPIVARFSSDSGTDLFYFKVEQQQGRFSQVTIYGRFFDPISEAAWLNLRHICYPALWHGPDPFEAAYMLGTSGPIGVALRVDGRCNLMIGLYFDVPLDRETFCERALEPALARWGWSGAIADSLAGDVRAIFGPGKVGWVALRGDAEGRLLLGMDAAQVPVEWVKGFLEAKGVEPDRLQFLDYARQRLRLNVLNYAGFSYNENGFRDWKVYVAITRASIRARSI